MDLSAVPNLKAWLTRCLDRPAARAALALKNAADDATPGRRDAAHRPDQPAVTHASPARSTSARPSSEALALHQQGRLDEAEKLYTRVLKAQRDNFDALHLLGMLNHQRGKAGEAYRLITAALKVQPRSPDALSNLALVLHALKRSDEALAQLDKALALAPGHLDALNNRGNVLLDLKRPAEAVAAFDAVLATGAASCPGADQPRQCPRRDGRGRAGAGRLRRGARHRARPSARALQPRQCAPRARPRAGRARGLRRRAGGRAELSQRLGQPRHGAGGAQPPPGRARELRPRAGARSRTTPTCISTPRCRC